MPLGSGIFFERGRQRGYFPQNRYFTAINFFSVRTVADEHTHTGTGDELSGGTNTDDLK